MYSRRATGICTLVARGGRTHIKRTFSLPVNNRLAERLTQDLLNGNRRALAQSITLVESTNNKKREIGEAILSGVLQVARQKYNEQGSKSLIFRLGLSGSPGVGKSTLIESLGMYLIKEHKMKVAVVTVDPSSQTTGGSLLGDLTRMDELSKSDYSYIRTSPSRGTLGGVTRGTYETIVLCEAAGYDLVLVETVGVGQSEVVVSEMVDMFCLLVSPAHGDELQGIKRGVMELADMVLVTKADGDLENKATQTQSAYLSALKFIKPRSINWRPKVMRVSARNGSGIADFWTAVCKFKDIQFRSGEVIGRRRWQLEACMWRHVTHQLLSTFKAHPSTLSRVHELEQSVKDGKITPGKAADILIENFFESISDRYMISDGL